MTNEKVSIEEAAAQDSRERRAEQIDNDNPGSFNFSKLGLLKAIIFNRCAEASSILNSLV